VLHTFEPEGREFESLRARQLIPSSTRGTSSSIAAFAVIVASLILRAVRELVARTFVLTNALLA